MADRDEIIKVVDRDLEEIEQKLLNGGASDPIVMGRAVSMLLRHVRILVARATVTEAECERRRMEIVGDGLKGAHGVPVQILVQILRDIPPWGVVAYLAWRFVS